MAFEIITENVYMPAYGIRRYKYKSLDPNGKKWTVTDTQTGIVIYNGKYEMSAIVCHNLNKKFYRNEKVVI